MRKKEKMENGQEAPAGKPDGKPGLDRFVNDMIEHAQELHAVLRNEGDKNDIKDRITCLKYLEDVLKTYFVLKKASAYDPAAAGSTVRKYTTAFAKNAAGSGAKGRRGRNTAAFDTSFESDDTDGGGGSGHDAA